MDSSKDKFLKNGITGNGLKILAMLSMLIDHAAVSLMLRDNDDGDTSISGPEPLYIILRLFGRLAFPIFIFLLIEGYRKTHSKLMYFLRIVLFALISEIPFDMAFWVNPNEGDIIEFKYQNVFFTLAFGFLIIWLTDIIYHKFSQMITANLLVAAVVIVVDVFAMAIGPDYGILGVMAIFVAYLFRADSKKMIIASCIILTLGDFSQLFGLLTIGPVLAYNGKRGKGSKWLFYAFYPAHLLVLGLIKML